MHQISCLCATVRVLLILRGLACIVIDGNVCHILYILMCQSE